jgi:hypothetical protein
VLGYLRGCAEASVENWRAEQPPGAMAERYPEELAQIAEAWSATTGTGADIARWGDATSRRHGVF